MVFSSLLIVVFVYGCTYFHWVWSCIFAHECVIEDFNLCLLFSPIEECAMDFDTK
eukprot:m.62590 g.62590  ORF g.62590 m.62590 type:complete len:55 (+) comp11916_c0_seq8:2711-2875(+)